MNPSDADRMERAKSASGRLSGGGVGGAYSLTNQLSRLHYYLLRLFIQGIAIPSSRLP